jgi:hypothetical protein
MKRPVIDRVVLSVTTPTLRSLADASFVIKYSAMRIIPFLVGLLVCLVVNELSRQDHSIRGRRTIGERTIARISQARSRFGH